MLYRWNIFFLRFNSSPSLPSMFFFAIALNIPSKNNYIKNEKKKHNDEYFYTLYQFESVRDCENFIFDTFNNNTKKEIAILLFINKV